MSFGNAFGAFVPRRGGGGPGPSAPAFAPRIVVGNAPNGDTPADCDYLDPGDGTGIDNALGEANGYPEGCDVWVRPGTYDLSIGPLVSALFIGAGVRFWGAGPSTIIIGRDRDDRRIFDIRVPPNNNPSRCTELAWLTILMPNEAGRVSGDEAIFVRGEVGRGSKIHDITLTTTRLAFAGDPNWSVTAPFAGIRFDSNAEPAFGGFVLERVVVNFPATRGAPLISPLNGFCGILCNSSAGPANIRTPLLLNHCVVSGGDYAVASFDMTIEAEASDFLNTTFGILPFGTAGLLLENFATESKLTGCRLDSEGLHGLFVTNRITNAAPLRAGAGFSAVNCDISSIRDFPFTVEDVVSAPGSGVDFVAQMVSNRVVSTSQSFPAGAIYNANSNLVGMNVFGAPATVVLSSSVNNEIAHNITY